MNPVYSNRAGRVILFRQRLHTIGACFCFLLALSLAGCGRSDSANSGNISAGNSTPITNAIQTSVSDASPAQNSTPTSNEDINGDSSYPAPSEILYAAPNLGVVIDKEMKVLWVEPNSAAAKAGILAGDILNSVDDVALASRIGDVKKRIWYATKDQKLKVKLTRNGKDMQVDAIPVTMLPSEYPTIVPGSVLPTVTPVMSPDDYL